KTPRPHRRRKPGRTQALLKQLSPLKNRGHPAVLLNGDVHGGLPKLLATGDPPTPKITIDTQSGQRCFRTHTTLKSSGHRAQPETKAGVIATGHSEHRM